MIVPHVQNQTLSLQLEEGSLAPACVPPPTPLPSYMGAALSTWSGAGGGESSPDRP